MKRMKVGDRFTLAADEVLGTPNVMATVVSVESFGYIIHCDGDAPEWTGPVDFDGHILQEGP